MSTSTSSEKAKNKRLRAFNILQKCEILDEIDQGKKIKQVCTEYDVSRRTIRNWLENKDKLIEQKATYQLTPQSKRIRISALDHLEEALYIWFTINVKTGVSMTGPLIQAKAKELHADFNINKTFHASDGWLTHWKKKFNIRQYTRCGEKLSADHSAAISFRRDFEKVLDDEQLLACQIFNADETGLNFKQMPKKTLAEKSSTAPSGIKLNKDRITVMLCSNADGSLKLPLVVIGKSAKPRAIKNQMSSLPVYYANQKSAWMSGQIFKNWFYDEFVPRVTTFLEDKGLPLKAKLLLDNAPCHPPAQELQQGHIEVVYLPANTTSIMQPLDQGIIETFKKHYRSLFLFGILYAQKNGIDIASYSKSIDIKKVIEWISQAWDELQSRTIFKCWNKLLPDYFYNIQTEECSQENASNEEIINDVRRIDGYENADEQNIQEWIMTDEDDITVPTNSELLDIVTTNDNSEDSNAENIAVDKDIGHKEAVEAADVLLSFFEKNPIVPKSVILNIRRAKSVVMKHAISK